MNEEKVVLIPFPVGDAQNTVVALFGLQYWARAMLQHSDKTDIILLVCHTDEPLDGWVIGLAPSISMTNQRLERVRFTIHPTDTSQFRFELDARCTPWFTHEAAQYWADYSI